MTTFQVLLLVTPLALGACFLWLARWSRRHELRDRHPGPAEGPRLREGLDRYFNRSLSRGWTAFGAMLALLVIVGVVGTLAWIGMVLLQR